MFRKYHIACLIIPLFLLFYADTASAQSELAPWGNILGIRKHGQFYDFETSLKVVGINGARANATQKQEQRPHYSRDSKQQQTVSTNIDKLYFKETVDDKCSGKINVALQINAKADTVLKGIFLCISLPESEYPGGNLHWISVANDAIDPSSPLAINAKGFKVASAQRQFKIVFNSAMPMFITKDTSRGKNNILVSILLMHGQVQKGDSLQSSFSIQASGVVDKQPVNITVDTTKQGRPFTGFGGNFRLQFPKTDSAVIAYCLNNLRVAWGRVEMPWRFWQPKQNMSPLDSAKVAIPVQRAMEMAQKLSKRNIPIILTAWAPPAWAIIGKPHFRPVNGVWGNPLNPDSTQAIYKSITDYIIYLKDHYGVDVKLFSFNESDLGINIRVTPEEHDALIKGLGAYFVAHGLQTKLLLGDNSDATTYKFIYPTLNDPDARQYIGAVSFHSWRGWDTPTLQKWAEAATKINLPLIVGEGSIDAQASGYPLIFREPTYALDEINLYTRILNICQPVTILQWQLTTDYSPLIGGGVFGDNKEPLHPGQRFFNLKQLASTPAGLFAMPVTSSADNISCAALGDNVKGIYTLHLVNNGTTREVTITGLPANIKILHFYTTNEKLSMADSKVEKAANGSITIKLPSVSYCTLVGSTR
jgi:hypothetical protein